MITVEHKELIRREYFLKRKSIRQISRELKCSRKSIRKAIRDAGVPVYTRTKPPPSPVMDPYIGIVKGWLDEDLGRPMKQRHTAKRIHERLRDEYGYAGTDRTVRNHVRRLKAKIPDSHVPQVYEPGDGATFDFGEAQVELGGQMCTVQLACMRLDYSSKFFVCAFPTQRFEAFKESHLRGFSFLGGVPRRIRYDNLKVAVDKILRGRDRKEQDSWTAFRSHFLFEAVYCNPGAGQEKGGVENLVGYARRNYLVPIPKFSGYHELNCYLLDCCRRDAHKRERFGKSVEGLWEQERNNLLPLPARLPSASVSVSASVNRRQFVRFDGNRYSTPPEAVGQTVTVHAHVFRVDIALKDQTIASHDRSYDRNEEIMDPHHYLPVLLRKPGAFDRAAPIVNWRLPDTYKHYHERLKGRHEGWRGTREFIQILMLLRDYEQHEVDQAIEQALAHDIYSYDGVKNLLIQAREPNRPAPCPFHMPTGDVMPNRVDHFDLLTQQA